MAASAQTSPATSPPGGTRDAWSYGAFGEPGAVLKRGAVAAPPLGASDVAIRVHAAGLNPVDLHIMRGHAFASSVKFPKVPGLDVAGEVVAVGSAVTAFSPGDKVYGTSAAGSLADLTVSGADRVAAIPGGLPWVGAAALPVALLTALEAFERAGFVAGQSVFITAGAGGVGTCAIQLARVLGASRVVVTASEGKHELVKSLGATEAVDYRAVDIVQRFAGAGFDMALDCTRESGKLLKLIKPDGKVITITDFTAPPPVVAFALQSKGANLDRLRPHLESGAIRPVLDPATPFAFASAVEALEHLATWRATGKVVVALTPK